MMGSVKADPKEGSSKSSKDKLETWRSLSLCERLDRVGASVQKVKDAPYSDKNYVCAPKFAPGDPVAVCCQGFYYHAVVTKSEEDYMCPDLGKKVPLYCIKYPGWGERSGGVQEELLVEYDLIGTTKHTVAHELLYAHYWNKAKINEKKVKKSLTRSMFDLPPKTLQKLESKWQSQIQAENPEQQITFAQWIGLEKDATA